MMFEMIGALCVLGALSVLPSGQPSSHDLPPHADLETKWAKDVNKDHPLNHYPRMQMQRQQWLNLNGIWQWKPGHQQDSAPEAGGYQGKILVPYPIESKLSGVEKHFSTIWYRRTFELPADYHGRQVLLHFGAVNWKSEVWVNGHPVGEHQGGYSSFSFNITRAIDWNQSHQTIEVKVFNPVDAGTQPRGKQVLKPEGIFYTPCTGIWQTVWLEPVEPNHIEDLHLVPLLSNNCLQIQAYGNLEGCMLEATARAGGVEVGSQKWMGSQTTELSLNQLHLWTPNDPFLYQLELRVLKNGKPVDHVSSYFAMRSLEVKPDSHGVARILLNGKPEFELGVLDQGYWPDGIYTAPTDEALKSDIEEVKSLGMNLIRKHAKVEPDRWYYWADKLGMLVWQDMPQTYNKTFPAAVKQEFKVELNQMVKSLWNHPSIIVWTLFNEGWGQFDTRKLSIYLAELDPYRLINSASGWVDKDCGDFIDAHHYPEPVSPEFSGSRARVLGEYGGVGFAEKGHLWTEGWGYKMNSSQEELTNTYLDYLKDINKLQEKEGLVAAVYTQITDVEQEINGLFTYDRAVFKMNKEAVRSANIETIEYLQRTQSGT